MKFRIQQSDFEALQNLSEKSGKTLSDLVRYGIGRTLDGEVRLPVGRTSPMTAMSFDIPREQEEALKDLSKRSGVPLEEVFRTTLRDLLANAQTLMARISAIAETQDGIQQRQNRVLTQDEVLRLRRQRLMEEDTLHQTALAGDEDDPPPRQYTRGLKNKIGR
jgi:predicted DNA-binding protein